MGNGRPSVASWDFLLVSEKQLQCYTFYCRQQRFLHDASRKREFGSGKPSGTEEAEGRVAPHLRLWRRVPPQGPLTAVPLTVASALTATLLPGLFRLFTISVYEPVLKSSASHSSPVQPHDILLDSSPSPITSPALTGPFRDSSGHPVCSGGPGGLPRYNAADVFSPSRSPSRGMTPHIRALDFTLTPRSYGLC